MKKMKLAMETKIKRWGNGNGILLPKVLLDMFSLSADDFLSISVEDKKIILEPQKRKHKTLAERFAGYTGETKQEEYWSDEPVGKELF